MSQDEFDFDAPFDGDDYQDERDRPRLRGQIKRVWNVLQDHTWTTVAEIGSITGDPQPSISAQLRNLRKERFGGHTIERRYVGNGLYEFRLKP